MSETTRKSTFTATECQRDDILKLSKCPQGSFEYLVRSTTIQKIRHEIQNNRYVNIYPIELLHAAIAKYGYSGKKVK